MTLPSPYKDRFIEKVINPYLSEVMKHPQSIEMHEGVLHIRDVRGPEKEGSEKARLEAVEQEIFNCQGMVERRLSANHYMNTDFIQENKLDTKNMGEILYKLQDQIDHLQDQIYERQGQNFQYESRYHRMSFAASFRTPKTKFSFYDGDSMP
ncbi:40S ribosomal protein S5-1 [Hordeum vulgare]|nr:40S ribosomal protein S5-1 [Hordeum vulgare]